MPSNWSSIYFRYEAIYARLLPESITGEAFVEKFVNHNDPVTVIDEKRNYAVKASARHPVYENFRVKVWNYNFQHQLRFTINS